MKPNRWLSSIWVVALAVTLVAGCDSGSPVATPVSPGNPTATTGTGAGNTPVATSVQSAATAVSTQGSSSSQGAIPGVLRVDWNNQPDTIDPQQMSYQEEIAVGQLVFEGLMTLNEQNNVVPGAAEKMDVSADGLKYTLTIRDGLTYSDGKPLTARNFEYAWRRLFDPRVPNRQYSSIAFQIAGAEELDSTPESETAKIEELIGKLGVKATDDKHLEFTLKSKAAYFPYILTLWVGYPSRQDVVEAGGEKWTTDSAGKYYIGNGPFILNSYNENGMSFVPNPNYRLGKPKLKEIRALYIADSAVAFQSYQKGEVDTMRVGAESAALAMKDPVLSKEFVSVAGSCTVMLVFNTQRPPFDNVKVRQAFAQALNRQDFVDNVLQGQGTVALSLIPPGRPGYAPDIKLYEFNSDLAKKTLSEAGFAGGQGLPEIKLTYASDSRTKARMEWVQNQIENNLGINLVLDPVEATAYTALTKDISTSPQISYTGWCQDYPDPQDWLTLVFHSGAGTLPTGWTSAEFDKLVDAADVEQNQQTRLDLYHQAQELLVREAPAVFIDYNITNSMLKPYVKGLLEHANPADSMIPGSSNIINAEVAP